VPLKAIVDGEIIIGPDLSEEEWTKLTVRHKKGLSVTMDCCGAPGHLRKSKKGTRHFYHAVDTGCHYAEESMEHLEIKYQIYRMCQSAQWETYVEFSAPDRTWISDVYAVKDGRKIVFEIQISTISPADLEDRDARYRNEGIESYWLLDNFLERSRDFASWYHAHLHEEEDRLEETIPYIDWSLFETGTENHIFIAKGIRSVGLDAQKKTLFTTHNPEIPLADWVREVLRGNYQNYLQDTAAGYHHKRQLKMLAAPALIRFKEFYLIIRDEMYKEKVRHYERILTANTTLANGRTLQKKVQEIVAEIDWLDKEYRSCMAESSGLFYWKKPPENKTPRLFFRLESESKVKKLQECVKTLNQWEESFNRALRGLEREIPADKN
jgi:competence CoiA-like predicted nuclease